MWRFLLAIPMALAGALPAVEPPALMLATSYRDQHPGPYWVSEKLDGVRARWDGARLISRQGNVIPAPDWFVRDFPPHPLDGELWLGRGRFEAMAGLVRREAPSPTWRQVRFMVFDAPLYGLTFDERLARLRVLLAPPPSPYIELVPQRRVADAAGLWALLDEVVAGGGEGLMLHHEAGRYVAGRSSALLKLKPYRDADACVIAHLPGTGRLQGLLGALLVETADGVRFRLGTGFSDDERRRAPPPGSVITYRHRGFTGHGTPRFASFLRLRHPPESGLCAALAGQRSVPE